MTWLAAHYEWVIAVVVMPIVLLVVKRWIESPKKTEPSKLKLNSLRTLPRTDFIVKPFKEPTPNVLYIGAETVLLQEGLYGNGLHETDGKANALIIRFANEARLGEPNMTARMKAVLIYRYGQTETDVSGSWLYEDSDISEFEPDSRRHKLIAGIIVQGQFAAITGHRQIAHRRNWYLADRLPLKNFEEGTLTVQLMDIRRGNHLLYKGEFVITANPLSISPKTA